MTVEVLPLDVAMQSAHRALGPEAQALVLPTLRQYLEKRNVIVLPYIPNPFPLCGVYVRPIKGAEFSSLVQVVRFIPEGCTGVALNIQIPNWRHITSLGCVDYVHKQGPTLLFFATTGWWGAVPYVNCAYYHFGETLPKRFSAVIHMDPETELHLGVDLRRAV